MRSEYQSPSGTGSINYRGDFGENSYRTGLSWQPSAAQHYYVGWSDSFSPTADLYQLSGSQYPAERSKVSEIGAKWLLLDGNLAFRTALYHAVKNWERNTDLESTASILTKKRESNGIELELAGRMTENWEVFSGLSLIDAEINEVAPSTGNANFVGRMPRNTPKQTFNLWTTYQLPMGFKVGGGMEYKSKRYGGAPTGTAAFNPNWVPSYTRWDAMLFLRSAEIRGQAQCPERFRQAVLRRDLRQRRLHLRRSAASLHPEYGIQVLINQPNDLGLRAGVVSA